MAGGGSSQTDSDQKKARIEIIPLIDVIFFLLATFVLFTLSLNNLQSLPVQLPVAGPANEIQTEDNTVTLQVSESGTFYWNKEMITLNEVAPVSVSIKENPKGVPRVLIANDDRAKFGATVMILDEVRKAGIDQVSVETQIRPTGR